MVEPIWQESFARNIPWICINRGETRKGDILIADIEGNWKRWTHRTSILEKSTQKKHQRIKREKFSNIQLQMRTANLSGRDHEFREPAPRREHPVGSEDLSGELQGEPGESQPTDTTDDAEAQRDFWSIQGDVIYRHHIEPRVQRCVAKEETLPITHKSGSHARETYRWLLECGRESKFIRFLERIHEVDFIDRETSKGFCVWSGVRLTQI